MLLRPSYITTLLALFLASTPIDAAPELQYEILKETQHDPKSFTQGLILNGDEFIESSGLYGKSFVRRYTLANNKIIKETSLPPAYFAEGLTLVGQYLYLLTWQEQYLLILDKTSLQPLFKLAYEGEGWGLTFDGSHLIMSNGSDKLFYRSKKNFAVKRVLNVTNDDKPVYKLNELEYVWQSIWANIWQDDKILQIDPLSGDVVGELRLATLVKQNGGKVTKVLNGIAYDSQADALWITGKNWPKKYLIKVKTSKN